MSLEARRLALFRSVADRFQLESVGIKPIRRKQCGPVLGELLGFVENDRVAGTSPLMCFTDDGSARDQECEVMEACVPT
jgi:hypothetical protein